MNSKEKNNKSLLHDAAGKISHKRIWASIFFLTALILCVISFVISCNKSLPDSNFIKEIILALLGTGLCLSAATIPENIKKWRFLNNEERI